ncbi:asparagine synthase (glutamine-hydrolyzing) [Elioraea tepida]|uniref:asparagine synthase (glutamine-hydrolyzing) n=1 Tax=Elioraea tepida TaxID=2843330 RepID=A0A975U5M6_9PROT|nr:asparagine synthase (glutamine-hydrolyzing) [Elioraea tepida]QXM26014.1 asparagine synthase (glutamine-hydrolyzing) [Elioraea tepida]
MCGLVGFLSPGGFGDAASAIRTVEMMRDRIVHRGPDDAGTWLDAEAGLAFGFRRLSIMDLSPAGHQPMLSACGRYVIVFNGEIYNFGDLRDELEAARGGPHSWRGHSDTEVLLEAVAEWGVEATLRRTNGMFALAVWDRAERTLWLGRDRIGKKPLYYGWAGDSFLFGSELKALAAHPRFEAAISAEAVNDFLQLGYTLGPRTIFAATRRLPQGTMLRLDAAAAAARSLPEPRPYWSLREVALAGLEAQAAGRTASIEELEALLKDAVARRLVADVPVGAFLSGGIDSSLVTAVMAEVAPSKVRSFAIGFDVEGWDEARFARPIAAHLGTRHEELYLGKADILEATKAIPRLFDEPFADDSAIPTYLLCRMARCEVTVALSGDGGDEFFAGYTPRYAGAIRLMQLARLLPEPLRALGARLSEALAPTVGGVAGNRQARRMRLLARLLGAPAPEAFNAALMSPMLGLEGLFARHGGGPHPLDAPEYRLGRSGPLDRMCFADQMSFLVDDILTKVDRASMAVSLEVRCPLLDWRILELSWRFPAGQKLAGEIGKRPLRELLYKRVPRELIDRPKQGFAAPVHAWLLTDLRDWAEALLSREALARHGLFDAAACRKLWESFAHRGRGWDRAIWNLLMFQAWHAELAPRASSDLRLAA